MIRTLGMEKLYYETEMKEYQAWKSITQDKYSITVNKGEIDTYIEEGPDTSSDLLQHIAFVEALGIMQEGLNYILNRDFHEKYNT